ncbi:MAG: alpha/beta fold hydrolase [Acidimicrobiales bacterium]
MNRPVVLVHGAWHGAWCWQRVERLLSPTGVEVTTPTLTGLGDRSHLVSPQVGLSTHVEDIIEHLERHDLDHVVLVGHSYAGFVVREAADRVPERIRVVGLLDAWFGNDGESLASRAPQWFNDAMTESATTNGFGWLIPPPAPELVGVTDPNDAACLVARLTPHPYRTFTDTTRLSGKVDAIPHRAAVCADNIGLPFIDWATTVDRDPIIIPRGHDAMIIEPQAVADFIADAASA